MIVFVLFWKYRLLHKSKISFKLYALSELKDKIAYIIMIYEMSYMITISMDSQTTRKKSIVFRIIRAFDSSIRIYRRVYILRLPENSIAKS